MSRFVRVHHTASVSLVVTTGPNYHGTVPYIETTSHTDAALITLQTISTRWGLAIVRQVRDSDPFSYVP